MLDTKNRFHDDANLPGVVRLRKPDETQTVRRKVILVLEQSSVKWKNRTNMTETSIEKAQIRLEEAVREGIILGYDKAPRKLDEGIFYFRVFANWSNEEELAQVAEELADRLADLREQDIMILTSIRRAYEPKPELEPEA